MSRPQCATNIPMEKEVWSCAKDEGGPLASRDQEVDANRCKLLPLRAVVVSVAERAGPDPALVRLGETSESKPSMKGRKGIVDVETEVMWSSRDKLGRRPEARPKRHPARRRRRLDVTAVRGRSLEGRKDQADHARQRRSRIAKSDCALHDGECPRHRVAQGSLRALSAGLPRGSRLDVCGQGCGECFCGLGPHSGSDRQIGAGRLLPEK